jgi:hypothetical protein
MLVELLSMITTLAVQGGFIGNLSQMLDQTGLLLSFYHLCKELVEGLSRSSEIG